MTLQNIWAIMLGLIYVQIRHFFIKIVKIYVNRVKKMWNRRLFMHFGKILHSGDSPIFQRYNL